MNRVKKGLLNLLIASLILLSIAGNAVAANSFLQKQVDQMDESYRPIGQLVADNIVAIFGFAGAAFLLYDGIMVSRAKKDGKTGDAAYHENRLIYTAKILGLTLVLYTVFVAATKSSIIGLA